MLRRSPSTFPTNPGQLDPALRITNGCGLEGLLRKPALGYAASTWAHVQGSACGHAFGTVTLPTLGGKVTDALIHHLPVSGLHVCQVFWGTLPPMPWYGSNTSRPWKVFVVSALS